eukprot:359648-Chlamydomonas_euryale.AAC.5
MSSCVRVRVATRSVLVTALCGAAHHNSGMCTQSPCYRPSNMFLVSPVACQVCSRFPPVLHHFFLEAFRSPGDWFTRRTSFTRSVAVNSMAGYVIGLGDRHSGNILLDRTSAEVVHIDFGVAFEQVRAWMHPQYTYPCSPVPCFLACNLHRTSLQSHV